VSEKLFRFLLSELKTIRVICKNGVCGAIVEVPVDQAIKTFRNDQCPVCHKSFVPASIMSLAIAIQELNQKKDEVDVEFVIPLE
jgi:hypothetical protein